MKHLELFFALVMSFFSGVVMASTEEVPLKLNCYEELDGQRGGVPGITFGEKLFDFEVLSVESESTRTCRMNPHELCGSASGTALITEYYYEGIQSYKGSFNFNFITSRVISAKLSFLSDAESMQTGQPLKSFAINSIGVHGVEPFTGTQHNAGDYRKPETFVSVVCEKEST